MKNFLFSVLLLSFSLPILAEPRNCYKGEHDLATRLVQNIGYRVAKANDGSVNVDTGIMICSVISNQNNTPEKILITMFTSWNGTINRNNYYEESGEVSVNIDSDGQGYEYKTTGRNSKLAGWADFTGRDSILYLRSYVSNKE